MQAFRSFVAAQPTDVPFVFAYKGKYIVQVEKSTVGSAHVNAYFYVDNSQNLVDHDFEAGVPAAGQLTIEKTSHITPGSTAAFATELRAFLESLGLASISLQGGRAFNWYDAIAAYYEAPALSLMRLTNANDDTCLGIKYGDQVIAPKFTIGDITGYLPFSSAGIEIGNVAPSCPQDSSLFRDELLDDALVPAHTDVQYEISVESCDVSGGVEVVISPISGNYPSIRAKGFWRNGNLEFVYYKTQLVAIDDYDYSDITVGHPGNVVANLVPCRITKLSDTEATLEVSEIGSPDNAPFYRYVTVNNVSYYSDLYVLDDYEDFGEYDIESHVKDYLSVTTVTTTRAAVSIEDCTYSTEV